MLDPSILDKLLQLTYNSEKGILASALTLLGNLLEGEEDCQLITDSIPLVTRLIELFKLHNTDIIVFYWLLDVIHKLLIFHGEYYIDKFTDIIVPLINCCENVYNKKVFLMLLKTYNMITKHTEQECIKTFLGANFINFIFKYFKQEDKETLRLAVSIIGNILASTQSDDTENILKLGFLEKTVAILQKQIENKDYSCVKVVTWTMANLCAGSKEHIETVLNSGIILILMNLANSYFEVKFFNELIFLFQNCMIYGDENIKIRLTDMIIIDLFERCFLQCRENKSVPAYNDLLYNCLDTIRLFFHELQELPEKRHYQEFRTKTEFKNIPFYLEEFQTHKVEKIASMATVAIAQNWDFEILYKMGLMK
jgi:hypothetical protein